MIVLDKHTAPFFAPEFHASEVEATLDLEDVAFEARVARDIGGKARVVMQLKNDPARGTFVLSSIPRWENLSQNGPAEELWNKITSFPRKRSYFPMERMHFYPLENRMVVLHKYCCGSLIDLKNPHDREIEFRFDYKTIPSIYSAHSWQEYLAWDADGAFDMIEQVALNPQSELAQTLSYLKTDDEFKAREAFGCSAATLTEVCSLLKAVLICEMAEGDLGEHRQWLYWMDKSNAIKPDLFPQERLLAWKTRICTALGCRELNMSLRQYINTTANYRITGPQRVINRWLATTAIEVSAPTAHEILEAQLLLRKFERQYPL